LSITRVQQTGISSTGAVSSQPKAFTSNVTSGNVLIVNASGFIVTGSTGPTLTATDTQGNTYTIDESASFLISGSTSVTNAIFRTTASSTGANTVTVASSTGAFISFDLSEYNVSSGTFTVDATSSGNGTSSTPQTGSLILSGTDLVVAGFYPNSNLLTYTAGTGFTLGYTNNSPGTAFISEYALSVTGTITPFCTMNGSPQWNAVSVAYYGLLTATVYSSESPSSVDSFVDSPLNSDASSDFEAYLLSFTSYSVDNSFTREPTYLSTIMVLVDQGSSLESFYNILGTSFDSTPSGSESQYITSGITDTYGYSSDSSNSMDISYIMSSINQTDLFESRTSYLLSSSIVSTSQADLDAGFVNDYQILILLDYQRSFEFDAQVSTISSNIPEEFSYDLTSGSETQYLFPIVFSVENEYSNDNYFVFNSMWASDNSLGREPQIRSFLAGPELAQETDLFFMTVSSSDSSQSLDVFSQFNFIYLTDIALAIDLNYLTSIVMSSSNGNMDQATGNESAWIARLPASESAIELESFIQIILNREVGIYNSTILKEITDVQLSSSIDTYSLMNSLVSTASSIIDSALASDVFIQDRISIPESAGTFANHIINILSPDFSSEIDIYYMNNMIIYVDQGMAEY
jgi:hypothetical protein